MATNSSLPRKRGFRVQLSPEFNRRCSCSTLIDYSHAYDVEFCRSCDRWLADNCGDRGCEFCAKRPARPSLAADLDPAERLPFNPPRIKAARGPQPKPSCGLRRATDEPTEGGREAEKRRRPSTSGPFRRPAT